MINLLFSLVSCYFPSPQNPKIFFTMKHKPTKKIRTFFFLFASLEYLINLYIK
ncbi:hypothetical protein Hanom_Chr08g00730671 [Helianthus anomalus]